MSAESANGAPARGCLASVFDGRKRVVLSVALLVWGLTLFDLILLPRKPPSFLPALAAERLVSVRVVPDATVLTSADPTSPVGPWVLTRSDDGLRVVGAKLPNEHNPKRRRDRVFFPRLRTTVPDLGGATSIDIDAWNGKEPALFAIASPRENPTLDVYTLQRPARHLLSATVPLPRQTSDRRDFFVARWSGRRPELFVVDRNAGRRKPRSKPSPRPWSIRVYSGESGFRHQIERFFVPRKISRRASKYVWWLDVAPRHRRKPDLVFVSRQRKTGSRRTEIHILSGRKHFREFSIHAATILSQRVGPRQRFVFQPGPKGGAVLLVKVEGGELSVRALPLP